MGLVQNPDNNTASPETGTATHLSSSASYNDGDCTETPRLSEDFDSTCSSPYVSAPSSPGRGPTSGYFFSAPASPMHFILSSSPSPTYHLKSESLAISGQSDASSFEFEFSSRFSSNGSVTVGSMSSADELFLNGQIRPMKLSSHLQRPQNLAPLLDLYVEEDDDGLNKPEASRGRDLKLRSRSLHRKARSLSPLRNPESKSEGRGNGKEKFWTSISFSSSKEKKIQMEHEKPPPLKRKQKENKQGAGKKVSSGKPANGVAKRRIPPSPHELHYTTNRAQAEEMKKRTYLPYRQGLFGCLSFSSKSYGALNGLARSLNPVSSRAFLM
ncbi:hypothetical protein GOBAR_AA20417 [Gossypium barbadense]|uniref:DUF1645 domain-containing protein n=1 Tax=Gossypium barbadense TaxID=3634 RepID=A0A2P5XA86_GOSBA|nr:hypothetical protein GOBAR_AA20417 [Gossypium barbadense]